MTLAQLRSLSRKKEKELDEVNNLIEQAEAKKSLSSRIKKLGKCYQVGSEFIRIIGVNKGDAGIKTLSFHTDSEPSFYASVSLREDFDDEYSNYRNGEEIPYEEWANALEKILSSFCEYAGEKIN